MVLETRKFHQAPPLVWPPPASHFPPFLSPIPLPPLQIKYSQLIHGLQQENIQVNRKMLAELAANEPYSFKALVDQVRFMRGSQA